MQLGGQSIVRSQSILGRGRAIALRNEEMSTTTNWTRSPRWPPAKIRLAGADSLQLHPGEIFPASGKSQPNIPKTYFTEPKPPALSLAFRSASGSSSAEEVSGGS